MEHRQDPIRQLIEVKETLHRVPQKGIGYGILRYLKNERFEQNPDITFNYLGDFGSNITTENGNALFEFIEDYHGKSVADEGQLSATLDFSGMIVGKELVISILYNNERITDETIGKLITSYQQHLIQYVNQLSTTVTGALTPVDLTFKGLTVEDLRVLNSDQLLEDVYTLSPLQEGMYFHWLTGMDANVYFEQLCYRIKGELDILILEKSYNELLSRHGVLRSYFSQDVGDQTLQIVKTKVAGRFNYKEIVETEIENFKKDDRAEGFDLHSGTQMRLSILRVEENQYEFIWSFYHILLDGWSVGILIEEFFKIYYATLSGQPFFLNKPTPYSKYVQWLAEQNRGEAKKYWEHYLNGYSTISAIPQLTETASPQINIQEVALTLDKQKAEALKTLCSRLEITESTFVQTIWGILLAKYNSHNDVVFGAVVSGRAGDLENIEAMVGLFINTVPVRIKYEDHTLDELLKAVQAQSIASIPYHHSPLSQAFSNTELGRDLFDHVMVFENYPVRDVVQNGTDAIDSLELLSTTMFEQSNYNLVIVVIPGGQLTIRINFNAAVYAVDQVERLRGHLERIVHESLTDSTKKVDDITYITEKERIQLLNIFNSPKEQTWTNIITKFKYQVKLNPDSVALSFRDIQYSYSELDLVSDKFAAYLQKRHGAVEQDFIGVKLDRSNWLIIAMLGILKLRAVYVPIDKSYPQNRIDYILSDSNCKTLIDESEINKFAAIQAELGNSHCEIKSTPQDLAYVIYTSGSTGMPKGVMIEHASIAGFFESCDQLFGASTYTNDVQH
jgi:non-ribosomal peptide synthase protein (TIGR01720 family)